MLVTVPNESAIIFVQTRAGSAVSKFEAPRTSLVYMFTALKSEQTQNMMGKHMQNCGKTITEGNYGAEINEVQIP